MRHTTALGIDAGGTHTDAVLCVAGCLIGQAKVPTDNTNLPETIANVLEALSQKVGKDAFCSVDRVTLGTTLLVNAAVQDKLDPVGLALSAGPGLSPFRFSLGESVCVVPGGLDHRGIEVSKLDVTCLHNALRLWKEKGITAFACVSKFSPRNPQHELAMAEVFEKEGIHVTVGHRLSGELNFPRRIATAYFNAAANRLHNLFLDAVEAVLRKAGISAPIFLLKADGGSVPIASSRALPVQSILSGPAASVMGILALGEKIEKGCVLLLDIGGTTTDIAFLLDGSPIIDRAGMRLKNRRTLVRTLATLSIGAGGDSWIHIEGQGKDARVFAGPERKGPALAFGGKEPTLLDALNVLNEDALDERAGDYTASIAGMTALASSHGLDCYTCAKAAWENAAKNICDAVQSLLDEINANPIYTIRELKGRVDIKATDLFLVGGPVACLKNRLAPFFGLPVHTPNAASVANAVGAAVTLPTDSLQVYADTGKRELSAPSLGIREELARSWRLNEVEKRAIELLTQDMEARGAQGSTVEIVESDLFATLDDAGRGAKDMRVTCQAIPGILGRVRIGG